MKRNIVVMILVVWGTILHAEPQESFVFLSKISRLEQSLLAYTKYHFLSHAFPEKGQYAAQAETYYKHYEDGMRQVSIDLKREKNHRMLRHFIDAKDQVNIWRASGQSSGDYQKLLAAIAETEKAIHQMTETKILALSPRQHILYVLVHMQMLLEGVAQDYILMHGWHKTKALQKSLQKRVQDLEQDIGQCKRYGSWSAKEQKTVNRMIQTWTVLKKALDQPDLPLVIVLGTQHMAARVSELQASSEYDW